MHNSLLFDHYITITILMSLSNYLVNIFLLSFPFHVILLFISIIIQIIDGNVNYFLCNTFNLDIYDFFLCYTD